MATHSNVLAWRMPWTESLAGYSPRGRRVRHDRSKTEHSTSTKDIIRVRQDVGEKGRSSYVAQVRCCFQCELRTQCGNREEILRRQYWWDLVIHRIWDGEGNGTPLQYSCLENPMDRGAWWTAVHGFATSRTRLSDFIFTFHFHALEEEMATHSTILAWEIPWTEEPGGLQSMGHKRVGHDWATKQQQLNLEVVRY